MKIIDKKNWKRIKHFQFFNSLDYPHFNLCANVDIAALHAFAQNKGYSIFKYILYLTSKVANEIPEFRQRIRGEEVVEHDIVHPSYTYMTDQDIFRFLETDYVEDPIAFFNNCERAENLGRSEAHLEDDPNRDDYLFITCIPWIHFTSFVHPIDIQNVDSVPRISWGKYKLQGDQLLMPLSMQAHHALADGWHTGQFFQKIEHHLKEPEKAFTP